MTTNQNISEKKQVPWLLMGLGLLIPIAIITLAFLAAKSDAENQKRYKQQHEEIAQRHAQKKQSDSQ